MLIIRHAQLKCLVKESQSRFEQRLAEHLQRCFPDECAMLGDDATKQAIKYAMKCAARYGIESEQGVCAYADVMFAFGHDFDQAPSLPWAGEILNDASLEYDPAEKADRLFDAALNNAEQAQGLKPEAGELFNGR